MKFAVIDFETTGNQPADELIQVGLVVIDEQLQISRTYTSFVKPNIEIPPFITQLTGISAETVADAPTLDEMMMELVPLLEGTIIVGHHAVFDVGFLQQALDKCGYMPYNGRVLDTIEFLRILYPSLSTYQLSAVCAEFGIEHERPHQADSDALVTAIIWQRCMERLASLPLLTLQRLSYMFEGDSSDLAWFIHGVRQQKEVNTAIDPDTDRYFRQFTIKVQEWTEEEPARGDELVNPLRDESFADFYEQFKQRLQQQFETYEPRASQEEMIGKVFESFAGSNHLMVEAGTGTGKSLGYLIPALFYGIQNDKKVIVSTHTINLQEQLRQRDIPLLESLFPVSFRAAVLKGRSHYLCLRKFENKINLNDFVNPREDLMTAAQMIVWLGETTTGDEEELHFGQKGGDFWGTVASDTDSCLNRACPWYKKCFYHRARHEANISDVIITNHSLLFTDVKAENRVLPAYEQLVIDEAHHLEEVASKHLGLQLQYFQPVNVLQYLYKDHRSGQLPTLKFKIGKLEHAKTEERVAEIDRIVPKLIAVKEEWDKLTELLFLLMMEKTDPSQNEGQFVYRIRPDQQPKEWETLLVTEGNIYTELTDSLKSLERWMTELKEDDNDELDIQGQLTNINGAVNDLYRFRDGLRLFMKMSNPNDVYWIEANAAYRSKSLHLYAVPVDVSEQLKTYFFEAKESVIMTSATLSVHKSFQYACEQLGLSGSEDTGKLKTVQLSSPFQYRKQALVCIPRDFPNVKGTVGDAHYIETLVKSLSEVAIETKGRMLVLFTSYKMLKQVYQPLKDALSQAGIHVLGQGIDSGNRSKLTRRFQETGAAVLLGTSSFWEGVDIPGDALTCLAIIRLPFQPPNHPVIEAKSENLQKMNQNPFMKLSVPQAVIRFKQGFGRLVRTTRDRGIVIIYDTRVIEAYYGKHFLYSLPGPKIEHMRLDQLVPRIKQWFEPEEEEATM